ncbi:DUF4126 domain-containing protein [Phenylobacterium sp.]|uniref:DUF4126 domain-containing protein n=1 Tax=Phenylobacterium sp. TaxID=1871053 RepID=UPI002F95551B
MLLGLGLAASAGLKTFVPLLVMAVAARFGLFGFELAGPFAWLASSGALVALSLATAAELAADKIPFVDHLLSLVGVIARPAAGALAAAAAFSHADPAIAALAGLVIGAPTALAVHSAQATTRVASTASTGGLGNPIISLVEDVAAFASALLALAAPLLVPLLLLVVGIVAWRAIAVVRGASGRARVRRRAY